MLKPKVITFIKPIIYILWAFIMIVPLFIYWSTLVVNNWLDIIITIVVIGIFVFIAVFGYIDAITNKIGKPSKTPFKENSEYTNAVIYKLAGITRGKVSVLSFHHLCYNYIVDGREYKGWGMWYPDYPYVDTLSVGDAIEIMYIKRDPYKSITKRDFESK